MRYSCKSCTTISEKITGGKEYIIPFSHNYKWQQGASSGALKNRSGWESITPQDGCLMTFQPHPVADSQFQFQIQRKKCLQSARFYNRD
ncbi:MAG TPA: DUF2793 domain-containing protein [Candidatus Diapherotrites archaeon]|uniref:DUF2793 domain-containing protein n=1 Tax=Candidatus Iainarchaeum sp. TaxID=3101447 RepID=A0A7J4J1K6_9ARCH|nr:DUF2793 domain-containing protein [Candidatus Diapherotrites archaeon]